MMPLHLQSFSFLKTKFFPFIILLSLLLWLVIIVVSSNFFGNANQQEYYQVEVFKFKNDNSTKIQKYSSETSRKSTEENNKGIDGIDPPKNLSLSITTSTSTGNQTINKIVIGAISCRNGSDMRYAEETTVMLKSLLISAKLYEIGKVDIHMFLEHMKEDEIYFRKKLETFGYHLKNNYTDDTGFKVKLTFYSALKAIPENYHNPMVYHPRYRCAWVRFFFPSALPKVDAIIHLDSDMIITGSIKKIWNNFNLMTGEQLLGVARGNEVSDRFYKYTQWRWFGDIPRPPPRGVNAGLLLMNLTKMRDYRWENKFLRVYNDYSKLVELTGQRAFNILLYYDPGLLLMLSCQFNFFHRHCGRGFTCGDAIPDGVQLIHGNGRKLEQGKIFHGIFQAYKNFNMSKWINVGETEKSEFVNFIKDSLMTPIRSWFRKGPNPCFGSLNHVIFKHFYKESVNYTLTNLKSNISFFSDN